ncbi:MAG: hypothetical protein ACK5LV_09075, partial [Lachnospirales bacterium]
KDEGIIVAMTLVELPKNIYDMNPSLNYILTEVAQGYENTLSIANELIEKGIYKPIYEHEFGFTPKEYIEGLTHLKENTSTGRFVMKIK